MPGRGEIKKPPTNLLDYGFEELRDEGGYLLPNLALNVIPTRLIPFNSSKRVAPSRLYIKSEEPGVTPLLFCVVLFIFVLYIDHFVWKEGSMGSVEDHIGFLELGWINRMGMKESGDRGCVWGCMSTPEVY